MKAKFFLLIVIAIVFSQQLFSSDYYLNSKTGSDGSSGSQLSPWKTLIPLQNLVLKPGDNVYFACGSGFSGGIIVNSSGSEKLPITFSSYGKGQAPEFTNPDFNIFNGNVFQIAGSNIVIKGLKFSHTTGCTLKDSVSVDVYWKNEEVRTRIDKKVLLVGAVYQNEGASHLTIRNCEFEDCPIAIYLNGQNNLIESNYIHDCNRVLWDPLWGPLAIVIANAHNEISHNRCINYKREGGTFGADGGFIELDSRYYGDDIHDIYIHHNFSQANEGFMEITNSGKNLNISYNVSDDYQQFIFFWDGDSSTIENNTVIRTRPANSGVNVVFTFKNSGYLIRNNIFVLSDSLQVFAGGAYDARNFNQVHENNLYFLPLGNSLDPIGQFAGKGEIIADPKFRNAEKSDFRLHPMSPAIDKGQNLGDRVDYLNKTVPSGKRTDIGAFEF